MPAAAEAGIEALRRRRFSGPAIARHLGRLVSSVGIALRRLGLGRLAALHPTRQVIRYERERPGELIHIDTKKLGRIESIGPRITGDRTGQSRPRRKTTHQPHRQGKPPWQRHYAGRPMACSIWQAASRCCSPASWQGLVGVRRPSDAILDRSDLYHPCDGKLSVA
jgi:hypothetical protein